VVEKSRYPNGWPSNMQAALYYNRKNRLGRLAGDETPVDPLDPAAVIDADAAVAKIPTAASYTKDITWQMVYNESAAGRWQYMRHCFVMKTDATANKYIDLKGSAVITPTGSPVFTARGGVLFEAGVSASLDINLSALYADRLQYQIGGMITDLTATASENVTIFSAVNPSGASKSHSIIWANAINQYNISASIGFPPGSGIARTSIFNKVFTIRATGTAQGLTGEYKDLTTTVPITAYAAGSAVLPNELRFHKLNSATASVGTVSFNLFYVADMAMDFDGFAANMEQALYHLGYDDSGLSKAIQDGDSLHLFRDNVAPQEDYYGFVDYIPSLPVANRFDFSLGGRQLATIASGIAAKISANPTADSMLVGGGINDIRDGDRFSELQGYADTIFSAFDASSRIRYLIWKEVTPQKGTDVAQTSILEGDGTFEAEQEATDLFNEYLRTESAKRQGCIVPGLYAALESSSGIFRDYMEGLIKDTVVPLVDTKTNGNKGMLTVEGLHTKLLGAQVAGAIVESDIAVIKYYTGNRVI